MPGTTCGRPDQVHTRAEKLQTDDGLCPLLGSPQSNASLNSFHSPVPASTPRCGVHRFPKYFFSLIPNLLEPQSPGKGSFSPFRMLACQPKARISSTCPSLAAQIAANQANAKLSTGPKTEAGKAVSSHNAVRTALTGRTVLLPTDDVEAYQQHVARFEAQYQPVTDREKELTQNIADTQWRLNRIFALEQGIYAVGRLEFAKLYENEDASVRSALIDVKTFTTYQRQFNNLSLQEERLRRHFVQDSAELEKLIRDREIRRKVDMACALANMQNAKAEGLPFDPREIGFDFSTADVLAYEAAANRRNDVKQGSYYSSKHQKAA